MKLTYKLFHNLNEVKTSGMWFLYDVPDFGRTRAVIAHTERLLFRRGSGSWNTGVDTAFGETTRKEVTSTIHFPPSREQQSCF